MFNDLKQAFLNTRKFKPCEDTVPTNKYQLRGKYACDWPADGDSIIVCPGLEWSMFEICPPQAPRWGCTSRADAPTALAEHSTYAPRFRVAGR